MVVPKVSVGIIFCTAGTPGAKLMVMVAGTAKSRPGKMDLGRSASLNRAMQMGYMVKAMINTPMPP